jgi:hypothetical protein
MFTLEKATQIFPDTASADVVPAITARFRLLSAEDQLALIWYAYLEMGNTITVAAPGAARMQFAEPVLNQIKAMNFAEQSQVMCELANRADTQIGRTYACWSVNIKLGFWYQLGEWMAAGFVAPIPDGYQLSPNASAVLGSVKAVDQGQQITLLRNFVVDMGYDRAHSRGAAQAGVHRGRYQPNGEQLHGSAERQRLRQPDRTVLDGWRTPSPFPEANRWS